MQQIVVSNKFTPQAKDQINDEIFKGGIGAHGQGIKITPPNIIKGTSEYQTVISNDGIWEGSFYFEIQVLHLGQNGNLRVGITNSELNNVLDTPVGYHLKSYSYRVSDGSIFNDSQSKQFGIQVKENDILGILVYLGPLEPPLQQFSQRESCLIYFVNGNYIGIAFENLYTQKYFAALSLYSSAECKFELENCQYKYNIKLPEDIIQKYPLITKASSFTHVVQKKVELNHSYFQ